VVLALIGLLTTALACAANPADDDDDLAPLEIAMGTKAAHAFCKHATVTTRGPAVERLRAILKRLAAHSGRPNLPYSVAVVEDRHINAITFPGGQIYVFRGLLNQGLDEAMLAGTLAHEVAHAAHSHSYRAITSQHALSLVAGQDASSGMAGMLLTRGVGRTYENQADRFGVHIAYEAGYDPQGIIRTLQLLKRLSGQSPDLLGGLLATHPPVEVRIAKVQAEIRALKHP
jgi:beta-barrel assembly-enhancing protease